MNQRDLKTVLLTKEMVGLSGLADRLTQLKRLVSSQSQPITQDDLCLVINQAHALLFLQVISTGQCFGEITGSLLFTRVPMVNEALLGPIVVDKDPCRRGWGTPLLRDGLAKMWQHWPSVNRVDLTTNPKRGLVPWYERNGFVCRETAPMRLERRC